MATLSIIGTKRDYWNKEDVTTAATFSPDGFNMRSFLTSTPAPSTQYGRFRISPDPAVADTEFNQVAAFFYGVASAGDTAKVRIWGVSQVNGTSDHMGVLLGELTLTFGSAQGVSPGAFNNPPTIPTMNFVKAISVDVDASNLPPGIRVIGDSGDGIAMILLDATGSRSVFVEMNTNNGDCTSVGVVWRPL